MARINAGHFQGFSNYLQFPEPGVIDLCHNVQVNVGDEIWWGNSPLKPSYVVEKIINQRPARGNWGHLDIPDWYRLKIKRV